MVDLPMFWAGGFLCGLGFGFFFGVLFTHLMNRQS